MSHVPPSHLSGIIASAGRHILAPYVCNGTWSPACVRVKCRLLLLVDGTSAPGGLLPQTWCFIVNTGQPCPKACVAYYQVGTLLGTIGTLT